MGLQVDHLLHSGADPALLTAAGELPIELIPVCGERMPGGGIVRMCRCMSHTDQEVGAKPPGWRLLRPRGLPAAEAPGP